MGRRSSERRTEDDHLRPLRRAYVVCDLAHGRRDAVLRAQVPKFAGDLRKSSLMDREDLGIVVDDQAPVEVEKEVARGAQDTRRGAADTASQDDNWCLVDRNRALQQVPLRVDTLLKSTMTVRR